MYYIALMSKRTLKFIFNIFDIQNKNKKGILNFEIETKFKIKDTPCLFSLIFTVHSIKIERLRKYFILSKK